MKDFIKIDFKFIPLSDILIITPLVEKLGNNSVEKGLLQKRILEMSQQNYSCIGMYDEEKLIGCCGLWTQTRHYAGKNMEADHVFIEEAYRNKKIGDQLFKFVETYARENNYDWIELNTYVENFPSHKFYYNLGFVARGYHFIKKLN